MNAEVRPAMHGPDGRPRQSPPRLLTPIREFLGTDDVDDDSEDWAIRHLVPSASVTILGGDPKVGKTWMAMYLGVSVASGESAFGRHDVKAGPVILVSEEDTPRELRRRLTHLGRGMNRYVGDLPVFVAARRGVSLDDRRWQRALEAEIRAVKPTLLVFDALARLHRQDENDRSAMREVTAWLQRSASDFNVAVLLIHHFRKSGPEGGGGRPGNRLRGTSDLYALGRQVIGMDAIEGGDVRVTAEGNYGPRLDPFVVRLEHGEDEGGKYARVVCRGSTDEVRSAALEDAIFACVRGKGTDGATKREIRAEVSGNNDAKDRAVARLVERGVLRLDTSLRQDASGRERDRGVYVAAGIVPPLGGDGGGHDAG